MEAGVSIGAYGATLRWDGFSGLNQTVGSFGNDPAVAAEAENAITRNGVLMPMATCELKEAALPHRIETLCRLYRRWGNAGEILIAASGGKLYWSSPSLEEWLEIPMPEGFPTESYQSNVWSYVTYEINDGESLKDAGNPVDVMLLSNARDGMICIRGDSMTASVVETPKRFGVIARFAERIWGGAIEEDPDMLVYSAPYDPFDWAQNPDIPEDGAGDIQQPSWDGDSFQCLTAFGSQLIAFKKNRVWRVLGTNPGEYTFKEQYGGGADFARTVAVDKTTILMLGRNGLLAYDGESVNPFRQEAARNVWEGMNQSLLEGSCACLYNGKYYLAFPYEGARGNNAVLIFDTRESTWLLRTGIHVESFLPTETRLLYTSSETPGRIWQWHEDPFRENRPVEGMRWVSPWMDLGCKNRRKSGFEVYVTVDTDRECGIDFSICTEKKIRTKRLQAAPNMRQKRIRFGGNGRRFRLMIESETEVPWRIVGGMMMVADTDED